MGLLSSCAGGIANFSTQSDCIDLHESDHLARNHIRVAFGKRNGNCSGGVKNHKDTKDTKKNLKIFVSLWFSSRSMSKIGELYRFLRSQRRELRLRMLIYFVT